MMSSRRSKNYVSRRTKAALLSLERCEPRQLQSGLQGTADVTTSIKQRRLLSASCPPRPFRA